MVTAPLQLWVGKGGRWHFMSLGEAETLEVRTHSFLNPRGFGSVRVECAIGELVWRTSLFPQKGGGYLLPVKAEICRRVGIAAGDEVTVGLGLV